MAVGHEDGGEHVTRLLIALDVDGTTVRHDGATISPRVHAAVRAVHAAGHHVVLSTGRSPLATVPVTAALGLTGGFAVCSNGAVTLRLDASEADRCTVVVDATFDPAALLAALRRERPGCAVAVEVPGARGFRATAAFRRGELPGDVLVVPWDELGVRGANRLIVDAGDGAAHFARIADDLGLDCVQETTGATGAVEIGPRGVSKASALEALRTTLGVATADTVAVGDHLNDMEMLRWAARGIAMGHAPAIVRETADEVTTSCDDDGLAIVLESVGARQADHTRASTSGFDHRRH
jgi:hydroxymethylpyrimidine pyrophosphatase-like HAD family hydrolase